MRTMRVGLSVLALLAIVAPSLAQDAARVPGTPGEAPLSRNGAGPDSAITGYSESGNGGTGGSGGILSNGTSDNAGSATGGRVGGDASQSEGGSGG